MQTVIIVLGNPPKEDGTIPNNLRSRLDLAINEYLSNPGSRLLLTGGSVYGKNIEAVEMQKYCIRKGIPENRIYLEKNARSTYDNALYTARLVKNFEYDKIIIVTSRYHKKRTDLIFKHYYTDYSISIPRFTVGYFIKNIHLYAWEIYLTIKLRIKDDERLKRKI
jgi:uncharacterized SAM-binding protein YcdF (DUF218 family)